MNEAEVFKTVVAVLARELGCNPIDAGIGKYPAEVTNTTRLKEDLGCDSLEVVALCMELEQEFDIDIDDTDMDGLLDVGALVKYIHARV